MPDSEWRWKRGAARETGEKSSNLRANNISSLSISLLANDMISDRWHIRQQIAATDERAKSFAQGGGGEKLKVINLFACLFHWVYYRLFDWYEMITWASSIVGESESFGGVRKEKRRHRRTKHITLGRLELWFFSCPAKFLQGGEKLKYSCSNLQTCFQNVQSSPLRN